jgi:hypothetical protein
MPKISDTWKPGFSLVASGKAFATGNYADGALNLALAFGQTGYAVGKNYLPKSKAGDLLGPRRGGEESLRDAFGVEAQILERGIQIVTAMTLLLGSGKEQGQTYEAASSYFELAWENLKDAALAGDAWSGESADAYSARNAQQIDWAAVMQELDLRVAALLQQNSVTLGNCKITMTSVRAFYTVCIPIAATLRWAGGPAGPAISRAFQWAMFGIGMAVAIPTLYIAVARAAEYGLQLNDVKVEYTAIAQTATVEGTDSVTPKVASAPKSRASSFNEIGGAGSAPTVDAGSPQRGAAAGGAPSQASAPSPADTASADESQVPQDDWLGQRSEPAAPSTNVPPAYAAMSAGSQVPGRASGSRASSAPSAVGAQPAPTREADAVEDDFLGRDTEAAAGAGPGERAPVDTAADRAEQAQERVR